MALLKFTEKQSKEANYGYFQRFNNGTAGDLNN